MNLDANFDTLPSSFSILIAARLSRRPAEAGREGSKMTVEESTVCLGRRKEALYHIIADKLPVIQAGRGVLLDIRGQDLWIDQSKVG